MGLGAYAARALGLKDLHGERSIVDDLLEFQSVDMTTMTVSFCNDSSSLPPDQDFNKFRMCLEVEIQIFGKIMSWKKKTMFASFVKLITRIELVFLKKSVFFLSV